MKDFYISLTKKQHKHIKKASDEFRMAHPIGWGCIANINCHTGEVHVALLTPNEASRLERCFNKGR